MLPQPPSISSSRNHHIQRVSLQPQCCVACISFQVPSFFLRRPSQLPSYIVNSQLLPTVAACLPDRVPACRIAWLHLFKKLGKKRAGARSKNCLAIPETQYDTIQSGSQPAELPECSLSLVAHAALPHHHPSKTVPPPLSPTTLPLLPTLSLLRSPTRLPPRLP